MDSNEEVGRTTRSGVLKRLLLLAGGAAGLGAIGGKTLGRGAAVPAAVPAAATGKTKSVVLGGRDWRHAVHDAQPGTLPAATAARTPSGRIVDARGRELVSGTYVAKQSPRELGGDGTAEFTLTLTA